MAGLCCSAVSLIGIMASSEPSPIGTALNEFRRIQLSSMPKGSPVTGPMRTQPVGRASNAPTPMGGKLTKALPPKQKPSTRTEAVRVAKAKITRRNSLQKQREALRG